jgi:hypothetical protein
VSDAGLRTPAHEGDRMSSLVAAIVAVVVGAIIAVGTSVTVVQLASSHKPDPVQKPLIVYGSR